MGFGLLWFDDDSSKAFSLKLEEAAGRYQEKFGQRPDICYINPANVPQSSIRLNGMRIVTDPRVLADHFLVGEAAKKSR